MGSGFLVWTFSENKKQSQTETSKQRTTDGAMWTQRTTDGRQLTGAGTGVTPTKPPPAAAPSPPVPSTTSRAPKMLSTHCPRPSKVHSIGFDRVFFRVVSGRLGLWLGLVEFDWFSFALIDFDLVSLGLNESGWTLRSLVEASRFRRSFRVSASSFSARSLAADGEPVCHRLIADFPGSDWSPIKQISWPSRFELVRAAEPLRTRSLQIAAMPAVEMPRDRKNGRSTATRTLLPLIRALIGSWWRHATTDAPVDQWKHKTSGRFLVWQSIVLQMNLRSTSERLNVNSQIPTNYASLLLTFI